MHLLLRGQIWSKKSVKSSFSSDGHKQNPGPDYSCYIWGSTQDINSSALKSSPILQAHFRTGQRGTPVTGPWVRNHKRQATFMLGRQGQQVQTQQSSSLGRGWRSQGCNYLLQKVLNLSGSHKLSNIKVSPLMLFCKSLQVQHWFHNSGYLKRSNKAPEGICKTQPEGKKHRNTTQHECYFSLMQMQNCFRCLKNLYVWKSPTLYCRKETEGSCLVDSFPASCLDLLCSSL